MAHFRYEPGTAVSKQLFEPYYMLTIIFLLLLLVTMNAWWDKEILNTYRPLLTMMKVCSPWIGWITWQVTLLYSGPFPHKRTFVHLTWIRQNQTTLLQDSNWGGYNWDYFRHGISVISIFWLRYCGLRTFFVILALISVGKMQYYLRYYGIAKIHLLFVTFPLSWIFCFCGTDDLH